MPKFWIFQSGDEEQSELFVGERLVGAFDHDTHGWRGMRDAEKMFENVARALDAPFERK